MIGPTPRRLPGRPLAPAVAASVLVACGGGGGSGGEGPPPPPQEPPVFLAPSAVRVTSPTPFSSSCLPVPAGATAYANAEVEPHLGVDRTNPNHLLAAWQQDRLSDGGARGLATAVSIDGGTTWSAPQAWPVSQCAGGPFARVSDPWVAVHGTTAFHIGIAFTGPANSVGARSAVVVTRSVDGGVGWDAPVLLVDDDGTRLFNDKETLTIDATDASYVYAVWDRIGLDERGPTLLARSTNGGLAWLPATTIYDPGPGRQTIGNVAVTTPDGVVHVFFNELGPAAGNPDQLEAEISVIRSTDKGVTWSSPTRIADLLAVGTRVPGSSQELVRAGEILASFAANPVDGTLYAAWQDARFSGGSHDAIALSWSTDGGLTWRDPVRVNADPTVPAFTPTVAVLADGSVGVMYYDFRQAGTNTFRPTHVRLAVSPDRSTWAETRLAGDFDMLDAPDAGGLFLGDYYGLGAHGTTFVPLYTVVNTGQASNRTDVYVDRVEVAAVASAAEAPAATTARPAAVPAWSERASEKVSHQLASVRERRRAQWRAWLAAAPGKGIE